MLRRNLSPTTVDRLNASPLWHNLCADPELQPEIRDNVITVYYRGGALLRNLHVVDGALSADVHPKFIPVPNTGKYLHLTETSESGLNFDAGVSPVPIGFAEESVLDCYKERMDQVLESFPEGQVVQAICTRPENQILDQEITFQESGESRDKIDLCHFDSSLGLLVFAEVKRKDDPRLFDPESRPEVLDQLGRYCDRIRRHRDDILSAYREVARLKRTLGLEERLSKLPEGGPSDLLEKPVLVIGNCSRSDVRSVKKGEDEWKPLMSNLPEVAAGLILCGEVGCRLDLVQGRQTLVF